MLGGEGGRRGGRERDVRGSQVIKVGMLCERGLGNDAGEKRVWEGGGDSDM